MIRGTRRLTVVNRSYFCAILGLYKKLQPVTVYEYRTSRTTPSHFRRNKFTPCCDIVKVTKQLEMLLKVTVNETRYV